MPSARPYAQPFVKWVGGKRRLVSSILHLAPKKFNRYIEPFVGGGAVALALAYPVMLLNDSNEDLMNTYRVVKGEVEGLMKLLDDHKERHSEEHFYRVRSQSASSLSPLEQAARFIYLNKTCFNGLYRVNKEGNFNVPFGDNVNPTLYNEKALHRASEALKGAELFSLDYVAFLNEHAGKGDFIYLDPPYIPVSKYSDFKRYTKEQFHLHNQQELAALYTNLVQKGCYPILSNSWTAETLYSKHDVIEILAARNINKNGNGRKAIKELIIRPRAISE